MTNNSGKIRAIFVLGAVTLVFVVLAARLFQIQIVRGSRYSDIAQKQSTGKKEIRAERGFVFDRTGREVAINVYRDALFAYPSDKDEIHSINRYLDRLYGHQSGYAKRNFELNPKKFAWIDRDLEPDKKARLERDSIPGLYLRSEFKRKYPFGSTGCQLLGCTDIDGIGISGLEYNFDSVLAGRPGLIDYLRDGQRNTYQIKEIPLLRPVGGNSIVLTVDWYLQEIVEEELKAGVEKYNAEDGIAVFLDCHTGEILAAADYSRGNKVSSVKLRAASDVIEPGSVFKIFTAAALIESKRVDPEEKIFCENGLWHCGRRTLRDDKKLDSLTFREIFELSSNIGVAKLALRLGGEKLVENARKFGFGQKMYIDLPGEASGQIGNPGEWSEYNIAALSIGHAISVTPLQLAAGIAAVANGGTLYQPRIIRGIINADGQLIKKPTTHKIARVMEEKTAALLREFMVGVVEHGTAVKTQSDVIALAGKTGTAEVVDLVKGGYIKNKFNASFGGFFPAENPMIAGIVILNQPEPIHYGGWTSGPIFRRIAERYAIANPEQLLPSVNLVADEDNIEPFEIPNFVGKSFAKAQKQAEERGIELSFSDTTGIIVWQYPPAGRETAGPARVIVVTQNGRTRMADLTGFNLRAALSFLAFQGISYEIAGNGVVRKQSLPAFSALSEKSHCRLICGNG